jgi:hypothetical protein
MPEIDIKSDKKNQSILTEILSKLQQMINDAALNNSSQQAPQKILSNVFTLTSSLSNNQPAIGNTTKFE